MKKYTFLLIFVLIIACQQPKSNNDKKEEQNNEIVTLSDKIAEANGLDQWNEVDSLTYEFIVEMKGETIARRKWSWKPGIDEVTMLDTAIDSLESITYNRAEKENFKDIDQKFINDQYWLIYPFHLVWDNNIKKSIKKNVKAPLSGIEMTELTVSYGKDTGYTPGDTYKVYVDDEHIIREWSYFPHGSDEPRMTTTWEDYNEIQGIKIAKTHQNEDGSFKILFDNISVN
jgi:hypothetical protein